MPEKGETSPMKGKKIGPKPILVIMSAFGQDGLPVPKENIELHAITRDAVQALDIMESGEYDGAIYKRVDGIS
jgi:hypothetical protein